MRSEWKNYALADVINIIGGGTPKRAIAEYWNGEIPWLSVVDFNTDNRHVSTTRETITELGLQKSSTKILDTGQIIISARGTVGALAQLDKPMAFNQSCYGLDAKVEYTTNDYLYYLVKKKGRDLQQITHGAVFDTITKDTFKQIDVHLPPLPTQKKIAHILSTLDDKIELNRKMNETLEAMAQALFKSWFVDFDPVHLKARCQSVEELEAGAKELGISKEILELFPSAFVESEMGMIPEGWEVKELSNIMDILNGHAFKSKDYTQQGTFVLRTKNFSNDGYIENAKDDVYLPDKFLESHSKFICEPYDFHLVMVGASLGKTATIMPVNLPALRNQNMWCFRSKHKFVSKAFINNLVKRVVNLQMGFANGSARSFFTKGSFFKQNIIVPSDSILKKYDDITMPLLHKMNNNLAQISGLQQTRDTLLPKLLSGELDVSEVEYSQEHLSDMDVGDILPKETA